MSLHRKLAFVFSLWLTVFGNLYALSQTSGRLTRTVRDPQGQAVPQAKIQCRAMSTGESKSVETNEAGEFVFVALSPAAYEVIITATAFAPSIYRPVSLSAGNTVTLNTVLQMAQNTTQILVNDAQPLVRTEDSEIGAALRATSLNALPLSSRNSLQLLSVMSCASTSLTNDSTLGRNSPEVSINGARVTQSHVQRLAS